MGIPYRRGYLLYGYPGTGKTSFILALASELKMNICTANLSEKDLSNEQLNQLFNDAPPHSIILLEDVDAAFVNRETEGQNRVTFSGLLNALDGVAAQEGGLLFMTTNKYELLDAALIRPGRVDITCFFGYATPYQATELFRRFFPNATEQQTSQFISKIPEDSVSMAELQGYLLKSKGDIQSAVDNVDEFINSLTHRQEQKGDT